MYGLSIDGEEASVVLKTSNVEMAELVFKNQGIKTLSSKEVEKL